MRGLGKNLETAKFAPNASREVFSVYCAALGNSRVKLFCCANQAGEIIHREKYVHPTQEEAVRDLLSIAQGATALLAELLNKEPELCQKIAANQSEWPVMADMTEKDWPRSIAEAVSKLELGKDIKGYLLAARTADENVIRCWAVAIYETLFQSRFIFKDAIEKPRAHVTTHDCPEWVRKTLNLPLFIKGNARKWARLGEEMLLQQKPGFLESPDLAGKKRSWTHRAQKDSRSGNASPRAIHREAFEDFAKELKNIAPEQDPWPEKW